ncbi:hypothetical protein NEMIN01_1093 [Nematocida minor]|uniref:uncharacterized protein n=1 Tax=Nematocida minor TaxID=1912983 RepID=UPI00221F0862|nr:uncharacterized protein NEMIN01_1093 [Nematocida minor]KAI5190555.1 hypothetical protein NEMIN01_1093 [Nematocida minor]
MHLVRVLIIAHTLLYLKFAHCFPLGLDSLCSCVNPTGVCNLLCVRPNYNNPVLINRTPAFRMTRPRIMPPSLAEKRVIYLPRPAVNMEYNSEEKEEPTCSTETETVYSTLYKTKTRNTLRVLTQTDTITKKVPVTVEKIKKITITPSTVVVTVSNTSTITVTSTEIRKETLPPVIRPITLKSVQILTAQPRTETEQVRAPPSIYVKTQTVTTTLPPNSPVIVTYTTTATSTVTATVAPTLYKDYVNINPLPDDAGILLEFHDSNNHVKSVNVIMPTRKVASNSVPTKLFSDSPKKETEPIVITKQKNIRKNAPTTTSTSYLTKSKPVLFTKLKYSTLVSTITQIKYLTKTKNKIVTQTAPEMVTRTVVIPKPTTVVEVTTIPLVKHVKITQTSTKTVKKTVPTTVYEMQTVTQVMPAETQTVQSNKVLTVVKTITEHDTKTKYITKPSTITEVAPRYITQTKTETETKTTTKYVRITTESKPMPTADRSKQYTDIISELRNKVNEYRDMLEKSNKANDEYHLEVNNLRSLLKNR